MVAGWRHSSQHACRYNYSEVGELLVTDARWLEPAERAAWVRLLSVMGLLPNALGGQLKRAAGLTNFEYTCLAMLSESPDRSQTMSQLAVRTTSTLARLSHVMRRLEERGLVSRTVSVEDRRVTTASLTEDGWNLIVAQAPEHVEFVRTTVFDALTPEQVRQLSEICDALLSTLDPSGRIVAAAMDDGSR